MKLLFLTQVMDEDDAVLGFVPRWIQGLARECERVRVVALEAGRLEKLPSNADVRVVGRRGRLLRYLRYRRILAEALGRDGFDTVLAHMVPRYALVAAGPARRAKARLFLWYTHKGVDRRLLEACEAVERVFTASPESLRVETPKKLVTGHGIDLDHFAPGGAADRPARLLAVGRITPAKDPLTLVRALGVLVGRGRDVSLDLVGGGLARGDEAYARDVQRVVQALRLGARVRFHGEIPYRRVPECYRRSALLVHASRTGSVDKVVLEAMAAGRPVLTSSEAFPPLFAGLGERARDLSFPPGDPEVLAARCERLLDLPEATSQALGRDLRAIVREDHEVDALMRRLVVEMGR